MDWLNSEITRLLLTFPPLIGSNGDGFLDDVRPRPARGILDVAPERDWLQESVRGKQFGQPSWLWPPAVKRALFYYTIAGDGPENPCHSASNWCSI